MMNIAYPGSEKRKYQRKTYPQDQRPLLKIGIQEFEVVMRPYKSVGALREAMNARVMTDARFLKFRDALS